MSFGVQASGKFDHASHQKNKRFDEVSRTKHPVFGVIPEKFVANLFRHTILNLEPT